MDTEYTSVVDPETILWTALAPVIHVAVAVAQVGLAVLLVISGIRRLRSAEQRAGGAVRLALGVLLLVPLLLGAHFAVSLLACLAALWVWLRDADALGAGRLRRAAIAAAAVTAVFMLWEREDPAALATEVVTTMSYWRAHELDWQLSNDRGAPKVGDLAPDFELQDPSGSAAVRLADFRGVRPVALVFGSYT